MADSSSRSTFPMTPGTERMIRETSNPDSDPDHHPNRPTSPAACGEVHTTGNALLDTATRKPKHERDIKGTFQNLLRADRQTIGNHVRTVIQKNPKWDMMTGEDRRALIQREWKAKLELRLISPKSTTAKEVYPDQWDEEEELELHMRRYAKDLPKRNECATTSNEYYDADQDDDEPLSRGGIKSDPDTEQTNDEQRWELPAAKRQCRSGVSIDSDWREGAEQQKIACTPCSRSLAIKVGWTGVGNAVSSIGANSSAETDPAEAGPSTFVRAGKRRWEWVDGEMIVFSSFEVGMS